MNSSFFFQLPSYILVALIFSLIILCNLSGYWFKKKQLQKHPGEVHEKIGSVEGSILGVMSLLLGFTFSVAVSKFEARRQLTIEEANDIGTAILRCDLYPDSIRTPLRADFKEYLETRIAYYTAGSDEEKISGELKKAALISGRIWKRVTFYSNDQDFRIRSQQMIPVLNNVIDIATTRDAMRISKVPPLVLYTLLLLILIAAFLLGTDYTGKRRNKILILGYAIVMTITLNLINELNRPRRGLINLDAVEQKMVNLRELVQ